MAETVRIEIPVSVQDKTDPSLSNITKKVNTLAKASEKVSKIMMGSGAKKSGIEKALGKQEKTMQKEHQIEITAQDHATPVLSEVEDRAAHVSGSSAEIEISAEDNATGVMGDVSDGAAALNGETSEVELSAEDNATETIGDVGDAAAALDGESSEIEIGAEDNATGVMNDVSDSAAALNGESAEVEVGAEDNATSVINDVSDAAAALDGTHVQVSVDAVDNASTALQNAAMGGARSAGSGLATAAGFAGLSLGIGSAINSFKDFEAGMSEVKAISGATEEQFASLTEKAKYMGATTKFTATEASEGLKYMAMAGWKPEQMEAGLEGIMNLAAASGESLGTTSDIVTDALTAFGLGAEQSTHFADILAEASSDSNTNVGIMGESFKYAAPLMGAMGYTAEDTATALGLMANAGIKGSMAGTTLRTAISNLAAPTKAMREGMEKYGISLTDETGKMKTLKGVMDNVRKSLSGLSEDEQAAAVKTIFGKQAMSGMLAIINTEADAYEELYENIQNSEGAAGRMKDIMLDNLQGDLTLMGSAWEGVQDTFGERVSPHIRSIVQAITDAMPGLSDAINNAFDDIDPLIDGFKTKVGTMLSSEEWKNADGTDKINIAWDTLIAKPFSDWAADEGITTIGDIVRGLFEEAFKILPGGEEAGLTSWLSAGLIGFGTMKFAGLATQFSDLAKSVGEMAGAGSILGEFATGLSEVAVPALFAAGAIAAVAAAIKSYNEQEIEKNLADHFGDITLTAEQTKELAEQILDIPYTANLQTSKVQFDEADDLMTKAEKALEKNKKINWKVNSVHLDMTAEEGQSLIDNMDEFTTSIQEAFTSKEYGAEEAVKGLLGTEASASLIEEMQGWFKADAEQLSGMSSAITGILQEALDNGAYDVNAEAAIQIMQQKMLQIVNATREARQRAQLDYLKLTASGAALDADSWKNVVTEMDLMRENLKLDEKETYTDLLEYFETALLNEHIDKPRFDAIMGMMKESIDNTDVRALANEWSWINESMNDAYGTELATASASMDKDFSSSWNKMIMDAFPGIDVLYGQEEILRQLEDYNTYFDTGLDRSTTGALRDRFETILPTVQEMEKMIDSHFEVDENGVKQQISAVPEALWNAYNQAMELGAAGGDENAIWAAMANRLVRSGGYDDFMAEVDKYEVELPKAFSAALDRASAQIVEDADFSEMWSGILDSMNEDGTIDLVKVNEWLEKYGQSIQEYIDQQEIDAEGKIKISPGQITEEMDAILGSMEGMNLTGAQMVDGVLYRNYTVKSGNNLSQIASDNGLDMDQILLDNPEITNPDEIDVNQVIKIRLSEAEIEAGDFSAVIEDSFSEVISESGSSAEVTAEGLVITLGDVEVDDKSAVEQVADALGMTMEQLATATGMSETELETAATITLKDVIFDTSALESAASEETDIGEVPATGSASVSVDDAETDSSGAYAESEEDLQEEYDNPFTPEGTVDPNLSKGTDNISSVWTDTANDVQNYFSDNNIPASATVDITLTYNITNPDASISVGGSGSISASGAGNVHAAVSANGRFVDSPLLSWVGEDGPEFIIPVGSQRKSRGIELWEQAGQALGIPGYADGGLVGGSVPLYSFGDDEIEGKEVSFADGVTPEVSGGNNGGVTVQVNLSPDFTLNDADESNILALIRANMKELADDLGGELAEKLSEAYENRPVA